MMWLKHFEVFTDLCNGFHIYFYAVISAHRHSKTNFKIFTAKSIQFSNRGSTSELVICAVSRYFDDILVNFTALHVRL